MVTKLFLRRPGLTLALACAAVLAAFFGGRALAGGLPATGALTYSGTLEDSSGSPLSGDHPIQVKFWSTDTPGTTPLCESASDTITLNAGRFAVPLPDPCADTVKGNPDVWAEVLVDGISMGTTKLGAVPYAVEASEASGATGALAQQIVPSGAVMAFNLDACPAGWTALQDAAGRVIVGTSSSLTRGATAGSDSVALTPAQMPSHTHTITDPGHLHAADPAAIGFMTWACTSTANLGFAPGGDYSSNTGCPGNASGLISLPNTGSAQTGITATNATGGGNAFDNRQASLALLYCQKD